MLAVRIDLKFDARSRGSVPNRLLKNGVLRPVKRVPEARRARNRPAEAYLSITLARGGGNAGTGGRKAQTQP